MNAAGTVAMIENYQQMLESQQLAATTAASAPVKIVGHKGPNARKKGLSLVTYPKSFLVGNRNITQTLKSTTNATQNRNRSARPGSKIAALKPPRRYRRYEGLLSPPLQVVNSQTMILTKRKIQEA